MIVRALSHTTLFLRLLFVGVLGLAMAAPRAAQANPPEPCSIEGGIECMLACGWQCPGQDCCFWYTEIGGDMCVCTTICNCS